MNFESYGPIGLLLAIGMLGYSIWDNRKTRDKVQSMAGKIDMAIEDVDDKSSIDIREELVRKAIERAVDREVRLVVSETAKDVRDDIRSEIRKKVEREVEERYDKIAEEVSETISDQVAAIDEEALKERVTKKAEEKLSKRLDGLMDGVVSMFNSQLGSANKLRQNIADLVLGRINPYGSNNRLN